MKFILEYCPLFCVSAIVFQAGLFILVLLNYSKLEEGLRSENTPRENYAGLFLSICFIALGLLTIYRGLIGYSHHWWVWIWNVLLGSLTVLMFWPDFKSMNFKPLPRTF